MSSSAFYSLLAAIFQIAMAIFTYLAIQSRSRESSASTQRVIDNQDNSAKQIIEQQKARTEEIVHALKQRDVSLRDRLSESYPSGYVLFGGAEGDVSVLPFHAGVLQVSADWSSLQAIIDRTAKTVELRFPAIQISQPPQLDGISLTGGAVTKRYELGFAQKVGLISIGGQPKMFFEVIDDDARVPVFALGFR